MWWDDLARCDQQAIGPSSADLLVGLDAHGMELETVVRRSKRKDSESRLIAKQHEATLAAQEQGRANQAPH